MAEYRFLCALLIVIVAGAYGLCLMTTSIDSYSIVFGMAALGGSLFALADAGEKESASDAGLSSLFALALTTAGLCWGQRFSIGTLATALAEAGAFVIVVGLTFLAFRRGSASKPTTAAS